MTRITVVIRAKDPDSPSRSIIVFKGYINKNKLETFESALTKAVEMIHGGLFKLP